MDQLKVNSDIVIANREGKPAVESYQYIVIRLGEEQYGIDIRYVENIVRMQNITRVPKVPAYLKGVINLRGEVIPVVSIRLKMGLSENEATRTTRIIILKTETSGNLGIVVDEVREVVTLKEDNIERVTRETGDGRTRFINGIGKHGNELISLLELSSITLDENA